MRADQIHVAVRPRSTLECLDLAVLFCGRRPLAVATATALGAAPMIALNRVLMAGRQTDGSLFPAAVLLALEAAWASIPLTLFMGQAVFARRFSWSQALRAFAGALPALVLFQGILRAVCLVIFILAPVVFIGMYYLGPIILLEQPPVTRVWSRRTAMNHRQSGRVLNLALLDAGILAIGTWLGTGFLGAVSAAWRGRSVDWLPALAGDGLVTAVFTWHGQIAFWATCGFLTVFRFFTYLDARIRREGWDVELKLRAEETYAGLGGPPARRLAGVTAMLVALVAGVSAVGTAAEDGGARARRALSSQWFPWYDSDQDAYRSLIPDPREAEEWAAEAPETTRQRRERSGSDVRSGSGSGSGRGSGSGTGSGGRRRLPSLSAPSQLVMQGLAGLGKILVVALLIVAVLAVVYAIVRFIVLRRRAGGAPATQPAGVDDDRLDALPEGARLAAGDLLGRAAAHAERGEFGRAMLFFYAWQLRELDARGALELARGKTNGQYAREVARAAPAAAGLFRRSGRLFEDAFFGSLPVVRDDFLAVWQERQLVAELLVAEPRS